MLALAVALTAVPATASGTQAHAVIAFLDTGVNPYHAVFRDDSPRAFEHPSTYLPGFPADAVALDLSLDAPDFATAMAQDCDRVWRQLDEETLYWVPGTRIVGALSFGPDAPYDIPVVGQDSPCPGSRVLDERGHGTMVASRGAAAGYGACPECLIVSTQGSRLRSGEWAADQEWIDVQSNSWGAAHPIWAPRSKDDCGPDSPVVEYLANYCFGPGVDPGWAERLEAMAQRQLTFRSSGNGLYGGLGVLGHPRLLDPSMTPSMIIVGGHDSGHVSLWHGFPPHVVADSCNAWGAYHDSVDASAATVSSGTSSAAPWAAGTAARLQLEARRLGSELGREELRRLLLATASPRPEGQQEDGPTCDPVEAQVVHSTTPVRWSDVPPDYPEYVHIGYGAVDDVSFALAMEVLRGETGVPDRSDTDAFFDRHDGVGADLHEIYTEPVGP